MFRNLAPLTIWLLVASSPIYAEDSEPLAVKTKATWGAFGPPRSSPLVAGDALYIQETFSGLSHDSDGFFDFSLEMETLNLNGEVISSEKDEHTRSQSETTIISLPDALVTTSDFKPGVYTRVVRVTDNISRKTARAETRIQVVEPQGVALFKLQCCPAHSASSSFPIAGATAVVGDVLKVTFTLANFVTNDLKMNCQATTSIFDADGKPAKLGPKDNSATIERKLSRFDPPILNNCSVGIPASRPGKLIVRIHIKDLIGKTETTEYIPFQILDPPDWSLPKTLRQSRTEKKQSIVKTPPTE